MADVSLSPRQLAVLRAMVRSAQDAMRVASLGEHLGDLDLDVGYDDDPDGSYSAYEELADLLTALEA